MAINFATEGPVDAVVARKLAEEVGFDPGTPYICGGKGELDRKLDKYNAAARYSPWLILRDQNSARCAGRLAKQLVGDPSENLCFRIVPRAIEAWLMGDRRQISRFLGVSEAIVPRAPESENDPKRKLVSIASRSSKRVIRAEMVPRAGSGISVGPNYGSLLMEFAEVYWRPGIAARYCPALCVARRRLSELAELVTD